MARGFKSFRREPSNMITSVTYYVDTNVNYTEDIPSGKTVLSPTSFVPAKTGYSFLGWREDSVASGDVLSNKTAKGKTMSLYAVFSKNITVTYYDNSTSASTDTKPQYYNNANAVDPTFQLAQTERNTWTARGWTTAASGGSSAIAYANNTAFTRNSNVVKEERKAVPDFETFKKHIEEEENVPRSVPAAPKPLPADEEDDD